MELLELIVRDRRLATDPEAARTVVQMCDGLPAALHVAGRWVRRRAGCTRNGTCCSPAYAWPTGEVWTPRSWHCASQCGRTRWTIPTHPM
ncbi:hypothetical protein OG195_05155 [Streptomyces sp. NBC_01362]|nr:hypothetical protein [Streptomyces sp. NBC_01362]